MKSVAPECMVSISRGCFRDGLQLGDINRLKEEKETGKGYRKALNLKLKNGFFETKRPQ